MAAAKGKDFVLIGPPGTGKSQTIANLIAQCLAEHKTVLFVSEKIAALDVVFRRLRQVDLGDFCLELHSSKARKLDVLKQLDHSWNAKGENNAEEWRKEAQRLRSLRDQLNMFVEHLHRRRHNGLTAYGAMGRVIAGPDLPGLGLSWPSIDTHDVEALDALRQLAERLDLNAQQVGAIVGSPMALIAHAEWSPNWQQSLLKGAQELIPLAAGLEIAAAAFRRTIGLPDLALDSRARDALAALARLLPEAAGRDWRFALRPDARTLSEDLRRGLDLLDRHQEIGRQLSVRYWAEATTLNLDQLQDQWTKATGWPMSWLRRRPVRTALAAVAKDKRKADVQADIDCLIKLRALESEIGGIQDLQAKTGGLWVGLKTRTEEVEKALVFQKALSTAIASLATTPETLAAVKNPL